MKVLVLGSGGREHALLWALSRSPERPDLLVAPGNPGMEPLATRLDLNPCDPQEVLAASRTQGVDLVVVGPEAPLVAGVADRLREAGIPVFGPGASGARLEGSKVFSKEFMGRHHIPTSSFDRCTDLASCAEALDRRRPPFVVKADGLAAGKGAFVLPTREEAEEVCRRLLEDRSLGDAGSTVVVEDFVEGFRDHRPGGDRRNRHPTASPEPGPQAGLRRRPGPQHRGHGGLRPGALGHGGARGPDPAGGPGTHPGGTPGRRASPYCGVLYAGLMLAPDGGLSVLEYNVRLGDPEAQEVLPVFGGGLAGPGAPLPSGRPGLLPPGRSPGDMPWGWCWPPRATPRLPAPGTPWRGRSPSTTEPPWCSTPAPAGIRDAW